MDRDSILSKIYQIKQSIKADTLPNIYLIHGELSDKEINDLYNHKKVKAMVNLTKGEGFGRPLLEFSLTKKPIITTQNQLKILSFNVRLFNFYETKESQKNIPQMMDSYLKNEQPDILCLQEFSKNMNINFSEYPHRYIQFKNKTNLYFVEFSDPTMHLNTELQDRYP